MTDVNLPVLVEEAEDQDDERIEALNTLIGMLSYKRPAGSKSEKNWIRAYLKPLGLKTDTFGNYYKKIGDSEILWSAHTDTVHHVGGRQTLDYKDGYIGLAKDSHSNCLGADNTAGCWILREMILHKVSGFYVFHRAEEVGGLGSRYRAKHYMKKGEFKAAIAFDRRDTWSIITHQACDRSCSDTFADSLAEAIGLGHSKDDGGFFTDTANYTDYISECTNVSAGTENEHMRSERLDIKYVLALRDAMLKFDESKLVYEREPGSTEFDDYRSYFARKYGQHRSDWYGSYSGDYEGNNKKYPTDYRYKYSGGKEGAYPTTISTTGHTDGEIVYSTRPKNTSVFERGKSTNPFDSPPWKQSSNGDHFWDLKDMVEKYPTYVADYLESLGITKSVLEEYIDTCLGKPFLRSKKPTSENEKEVHFYPEIEEAEEEKVDNSD